MKNKQMVVEQLKEVATTLQKVTNESALGYAQSLLRGGEPSVGSDELYLYHKLEVTIVHCDNLLSTTLDEVNRLIKQYES